MAVFSRSYVTDHFSSTWSGTAFGTATQYNTGPDESIWMAAANCPTRDEFAVATLDYSNDVRLYFRTSSGFSSHTVCTTNTGGYGQRRFDLAYERSSGELLIAYWNAATSNIGYRTYNGTTVSSQSTYSIGSTDCRFLSLVPVANSNNIGLLAVNSTGALYAGLWTGSSWFGIGSLTTGVSATGKECFGLAFESNTSDALIVYGTSGSSTPKYRTYVGGVLSVEQSMASVSGTPQWVRLISDPNSNQILCAILTSTNQLMAYVWSGSSWTGTTTITSSTGGNTDRRFDLAFEPAGTNALLAYSTGVHTVRYRSFDGSNWAAEQTGPNFSNVIRIVRLATGRSGSEVLGLCTDDDWQLNCFAWNGSTLTGSALLNDPLGGEAKAEAFALVPQAGAKKRVVSWKQTAP